jgi:ribose transport system substrate-binding protein
MKVDSLVFNCDARGYDVGAIAFSGAAIEFPAVPRTYDCVSMQGAVGEGSASMGASGFGRIELPFHVAKQIGYTERGHFGHATRRQLCDMPDTFFHRAVAATIGSDRIMRYLMLMGAALLLAGCRDAQKEVVGVVPKGANHIFWQTVHAGAIKAANEENLQVEWNAPTLEIDSSRQIAIIESMVNRQLAGIALAPVDRKALVGVVERAAAAGIPVAIFDSDIDTDKRITYIATDNREGGRKAARLLAELLLGEGEVAVISFMPGSAATMEREEGFREELRTKFPGIKVVQTAYGMADRAKARAATENIMAAHPNLRGLFADNESSSAGAVLALKARGDAKVRMVAFDSNDQLVADLRDRNLDALVIQKPFQMGYESVKAIGRRLRGEAVVSRIDLPAVLVRRGDLGKPDILQLLHPDIATWLSRQ